MRQEYATIGDRARQIAQLSFLDLFEKGHVYMSEEPILWDVTFQTAVAQAEVKERDEETAMHATRWRKSRRYRRGRLR